MEEKEKQERQDWRFQHSEGQPVVSSWLMPLGTMVGSLPCCYREGCMAGFVALQQPGLITSNGQADFFGLGCHLVTC